MIISDKESLTSKFLINREIPSKFLIPEGKPVYGYIYCIENINSGRKYIGSTYSIWSGIINPRPITSLSKRASHYIYEYNKAVNESNTKSTKRLYRPIIQAMVDFGIENFRMYPIAETLKENHIELENYFIDFYDTLNIGYNVLKAFSIKHSERIMTEKDKLVRSAGIIATNLNQKKLIISDSMKLLADYLGTSKDMIKNANRKGMPYKGWFIFYLDQSKRKEVLFNNVINDRDKRKQDRHSDKAKEFYKSLFTAIELYLTDLNTNEYFHDFEKLPDLKYDIK